MWGLISLPSSSEVQAQHGEGQEPHQQVCSCLAVCMGSWLSSSRCGWC